MGRHKLSPRSPNTSNVTFVLSTLERACQVDTPHRHRGDAVPRPYDSGSERTRDGEGREETNDAESTIHFVSTGWNQS